MVKNCEKCGKKLNLLEGKKFKINDKSLLLCTSCILKEEEKLTIEKEKKIKIEAEQTKQKLDKVFKKHKKILEEKRKPLYEKIGIEEETAQEIEKNLQHIRIDIIKDDKNYADFLKEIFPNLTQEERYEIYIFKWMLLSNTSFESEMKLLYNV